MRRPRRCRRRATILVTTMFGMIVLTAIILVFARTMRVEAIASNNRLSAVQAGAIVRGAEQYVLSLVEGAAGDPTYVVDAPAEAMAVGQDPYDGRPLGYFWLIKPDVGNPELTAFGVQDESAKINLNAAGPEDLLKLPGMTNDVADAIVDWRDNDSDVTGQGAEDSYYMSLPQPYNAKNDRLETVEELRLVRGMTEEILYGVDRNRDGVLDAREQELGGMATMINSTSGAGRGIAPFVTVYSMENNRTSGQTNVNGDSDDLERALERVLPRERADAIVRQARSTQGRQPQFTSVFDFCAKGGMTADEVELAYDSLHANRGRTSTGKVNINTAPKEVIAALPGLDASDVDRIVGQRTAESATSHAWVYEAVGPEKAALVGASLTNKSYQYSADIVAIAANGKSFKRVRIVVDGRTSPARIVYRKEVTDLGWPLGEEIRIALRNGETLATPFGAGGSLGTGLSQ